MSEGKKEYRPKKRYEDLTYEDKVLIAKWFIKQQAKDEPPPDKYLANKGPIRLTVNDFLKLVREDKEFKEIYNRLIFENVVHRLPFWIRQLEERKRKKPEEVIKLLKILEKIKPPEEQKIEILYEEKPAWAENVEEYLNKHLSEIKENVRMG